MKLLGSGRADLGIAAPVRFELLLSSGTDATAAGTPNGRGRGGRFGGRFGGDTFLVAGAGGTGTAKGCGGTGLTGSTGGFGLLLINGVTGLEGGGTGGVVE